MEYNNELANWYEIVKPLLHKELSVTERNKYLEYERCIWENGLTNYSIWKGYLYARESGWDALFLENLPQRKDEYIELFMTLRQNNVEKFYAICEFHDIKAIELLGYHHIGYIEIDGYYAEAFYAAAYPQDLRPIKIDKVKVGKEPNIEVDENEIALIDRVNTNYKSYLDRSEDIIKSGYIKV